MTSDEDEPTPYWRALWRDLSDVQRLMLARICHGEYGHRYFQYISTSRGLIHRGLARRGSMRVVPTDHGHHLIKWALASGVLVRGDDGDWRICKQQRRDSIRPDVARLAALGFTGSEIARELGVTREGVRQCCRRYGIPLVKYRELSRRRQEMREEIIRLRRRIDELEQR